MLAFFVLKNSDLLIADCFSLQGQGVEKDVPKGVTFLKKAMDQVLNNYVLITHF